ncbi:MAG TPA: vanadium-dependent haloperoxidase [Pyrinomonadaceae bacterium]|nr:vanadium-dependent haloperoxidase [Pyrinomonadaceae bacterium]
MKVAKLLLIFTVFAILMTTTARADEVADWNRNLFEAARLNNPPTSPLLITRNAALVQAAVFDAVNGIERRYTPIYVAPAAEPGSSRRAAVVQAAYAVLVRLYPSQAATLLAKRDVSIAALTDDDDDPGKSIERGIAWGQTVADAIWAWRLTDGIAPAPAPFLGGANLGQWRPTPPGFLSGAGVQFSYMTPWVLESPSQFRPGGPPALNSQRYAADFNEVKLKGDISGLNRTEDESLYSRFWNFSTSPAYWNQIALTLAERQHLTLSAKSRLMALVGLSVADAAIGCWDAKYTYNFWRPVTAIPLADTDGNPDTVAGPFTSYLITPNHPDYPSGHSCVSAAAAAVLASAFGENTSFSVSSDAPEMAGVVRSYGSFSEILEEIKNARVYAGIHFRSACEDGTKLGARVADYVQGNALQRVNGNGE